MNALRTLLAAALLALAAPAAAQPYFWGSIGSATLDARTSPDVSGRETVGARQLGLGWRFSRFVALEASYLDVISYDALTPSLNAFWSADGYTLAAVGNIPLSASWSLVGKLGVWDAESEFRTVTVPVGVRSTTNTDLGSLPLIGLGVEFHLMGDHQVDVRIRAIYEQVRGKDSLDLDELRMLSLGVIVQF